MTQYDVAIIGGGAAGLSAALVLARARRNVLVIDAGAPRNSPATHMHGYLSRDGMPPAELLAAGRHEVRSYGGDHHRRHRHRPACPTAPAGSGPSSTTGGASRHGDCWSRPAC